MHGVIHRHDRRLQGMRNQLTLHRGDLRNALWVSELLDQVQPDALMHLAAWSDVGGSWQQPWTTYELNIQCQLNLLESIRRVNPTTQTLLVTSNEVYGLVQPEDLPIDEETPFRPHSPYGVSKVAQDIMGLQLEQPSVAHRAHAQLQPHQPGQSDDFAARGFADQIAEIEAGLREPVIRVGNLNANRDFTDVHDVVRAYWLALCQGTPGLAYNVGSGECYAIQTVLDTLLALSPMQIRVEVDPARLRPSDIPVSVCDNRRLVAATGWQPEIDLQTSLEDLLDSWRYQVNGNAERPDFVDQSSAPSSEA